jgi:hypothetical protein
MHGSIFGDRLRAAPVTLNVITLRSTGRAGTQLDLQSASRWRTSYLWRRAARTPSGATHVRPPLPSSATHARRGAAACDLSTNFR